MGIGNGGGHQHIGFIAGKAEHHALVAGTGLFGIVIGVVHAHGDIGRLLVHGGQHSAGVAVKAGFQRVVADIADGLAGDGRVVHCGGGGDFTHDQHHAGGSSGFTGYTGHGVLCQNSVQNAVGDLVAHFIGMSFGYGFGCKNSFLQAHI